MIVTPRVAHAIGAGHVTQARMLRVEGRPPRLRVGHDYPIQVRRGKRIDADGTRIEVLTVRRELAGEITYAGAKSEGFRTTDEWKVGWVRKHDNGYRAQRSVNDCLWLTGLVDGILLTRFELRHAAVPVWTVTFKTIPAQRFLARPTRTSGDYVRHPGRAIDPAECVDEQTQERYAKATHEEGERRRASFKDDLEAERQRRRNLRVRS